MPTDYSGDPNLFPETYEIPSDGDGPVKAADVNTAFEALGDRTAHLRARRYPVDVQEWHYAEPPPLTIPDDVFRFDTTSYAVNTTDANALSVSFTDVEVGDEFVIEVSGKTYTASSGSTECHLQVHATDDVGTGTEATIAEGGFSYFVHADTPPITLFGKHVAAAAGTTRIRVLGKLSAASGTMGFGGVASLRVQRFRGV